jgi:hypothetical protein
MKQHEESRQYSVKPQGRLHHSKVQRRASQPPVWQAARGVASGRGEPRGGGGRARVSRPPKPYSGLARRCSSACCGWLGRPGYATAPPACASRTARALAPRAPLLVRPWRTPGAACPGAAPDSALGVQAASQARAAACRLTGQAPHVDAAEGDASRAAKVHSALSYSAGRGGRARASAAPAASASNPICVAHPRAHQLQALGKRERAPRVLRHAQAQVRQAQAELGRDLGVHGRPKQHDRAQVQVHERLDERGAAQHGACARARRGAHQRRGRGAARRARAGASHTRSAESAGTGAAPASARRPGAWSALETQWATRSAARLHRAPCAPGAPPAAPPLPGRSAGRRARGHTRRTRPACANQLGAPEASGRARGGARPPRCRTRRR